jgi:hypothetical protein
MQRKQVAYGLFHERIDLRFLRGGRIDLDVQVLEHMIDVGGHVGGTVRAVHHHPVATAQAGAPGRNADGDGSARDIDASAIAFGRSHFQPIPGTGHKSV